jgi:hypothetical protein
MMNMHSADHLREELEPLLPDNEITSVPWKSENGEWIVTVWDDGEVLVDIFDLGNGEYMLRKLGLGREVGRVTVVEDIPTLVKSVMV